MKTLKIMGLLAAGIFCMTAAQAQQDILKLNINYSVSTPSGSFADQVSNTSARGWTASLLYGVNDQWSVGLGTGYQDFYQKYDRAVYKMSDGSDISAVLTNSIQTMPLLATAQYNILPGATVQPYVGVGVGGNLVTYRQFLGEFASSDTKFRFAARPEAGIQVPFRKGGPAGFRIGGTYNYMPFNYAGIDNLNNWGVYAGIHFPLK